MRVKIPKVVAASKHEQSAAEAPSAVSVVTRADIERFGYGTLSDILRSVRGVYISSDEIYNYIGIRGVKRPGDYGGRILVMLDGHRMNEPLYDQAFNGQDFPLDVDLIERVEVIRGTGSSLYGNNAGLGVINVVTREASSWDSIEGSVSGGSYETLSGRLTYGRQFTNGVSLILSGTLFNSEGRDSIYYPEFAAINNGLSEDLDGERAQKYFASVKAGEFTLEAVYGDRRRDVPNAAYGTLFNTPPSHADDMRGYVEARHEHEFEGDWRTTTRAYYDYYRFKELAPYAGALPADPPVVNHDYGRAQLIGAELQVSKSIGEASQLTLGTEWNHILGVLQKNYDISPPATYSDVTSDGDNVGVYVQDEIALCPTLTLNAGLRYDWYSSFGDTWNPRVAAIFHPWEETTFKAIYGEAFRAPNAYEYDYVAPGYISNHLLEPEKIRSAELVWEQGISTHYRLTLTAFYTKLSDLIAQQQDLNTGDFFFDNVDEVTTRGAEAELEGQWDNGWRARASYCYAYTRDEGTGQRLSNSPEHLATVNVVAPLWAEKLSLGIEVQGMSERNSVSGTGVDGHVVCNVTLFSRALARNLELSASIYNLFDEDYADPVSEEFVQDSIRQTGRTFRIKATYRF